MSESWIDMYRKLSTIAMAFDDDGKEHEAEQLRRLLDIIWYKWLTAEERALVQTGGA